jgi:hypothetical protein
LPGAAAARNRHGGKKLVGLAENGAEGAMKARLSMWGATLLVAGCAATGGGAGGGGACVNADGALDDAAFVIAEAPTAGARVSSGFTVSGCSRTFESNVVWRLFDRSGAVLNQGNTTGGGVDGPGPFSFAVPFTVGERQIGHLEVFEEDVSDGEGNPPGRTVLPLVLQP